MAIVAEDAWKERVRDGEKVVLMVERRELVRVVALNIFKGWRAQVRGSRICPTNETSVQLRRLAFPKTAEEAGGWARVAEPVLRAELQAAWLAGRRMRAYMRQAIRLPLHLIWRMLSDHVHTRHASQLWGIGDGSMGATHVILFV